MVPGRRAALRAARARVARRARGAQGRPLVAGPDGAGREGPRPPPPRKSAVPPHPPLPSGSGVWEGTAAGRERSRWPRGGGAAARGRSWEASALGEEATAIGAEVGSAWPWRRRSMGGGLP
jgi:hypothetical protein